MHAGPKCSCRLAQTQENLFAGTSLVHVSHILERLFMFMYEMTMSRLYSGPARTLLGSRLPMANHLCIVMYRPQAQAQRCGRKREGVAEIHG